MVNLPPIAHSDIKPLKPNSKVAPVIAAPPNAYAHAHKPFKDRRKRHDRRRACHERGPFDSRCGTDRRKNRWGPPSIDEKA